MGLSSYGSEGEKGLIRFTWLLIVKYLSCHMYWNRRAVGSIPARDQYLHFSQLFLVRSNECTVSDINLHSIISIYRTLRLFINSTTFYT